MAGAELTRLSKASSLKFSEVVFSLHGPFIYRKGLVKDAHSRLNALVMRHSFLFAGRSVWLPRITNIRINPKEYTLNVVGKEHCASANIGSDYLN